MLSTCVAILAVDFEVFPVRFAKSESYGTSVMDVGPGGIIFAGGLVSSSSPSSYCHCVSEALQKAACVKGTGQTETSKVPFHHRHD